MEKNDARLDQVISEVAKHWSHFFFAPYGGDSIDKALQVAYEQAGWPHGRPQVISSDIEPEALNRMQQTAHELRKKKQAQLELISDDELILYVADFLMRAYSVAAKSFADDEKVIITEAAVNEAFAQLAQLSKDYPTDYRYKLQRAWETENREPMGS